jgi:hypothetical protein
MTPDRAQRTRPSRGGCNPRSPRAGVAGLGSFNVQCFVFDVLSSPTMNDLRFAVRQLLKNLGFTAVAVLTLEALKCE